MKRLQMSNKKNIISTKGIVWNEKYQLYLFFVLYFFCYFGLGAYFVSLSPHMIRKFGGEAKFIFLSGQLAYPIGYFFAGWISDRTKRLKIYGILFSLLLIPSQYFLFEPYLNFVFSILLSGVVRFLFAANIQILQISALETLQYKGFSISRSAGTSGFLLMQVIMFFLESYIFSQDVYIAIQTGRGSQISAWVHIFTFFISILILPQNRKSKSPYCFQEVFQRSKELKVKSFFIVSFFYYFSYQIIDFYLGAYYQNLGGMKFVYLSWILAVIVEIPFFPLTQKIIYRWGLKTLFLLSIFAGMIRFLALLFHIIWISGNWILIFQLLHGIHFTGYMAGNIYFFHKKYPEHLYGTAFGLFMVFSLSAGAITGNLIYGTIIEYLDFYQGYTWLFFLSFFVHGIVLIIKIYNKEIDNLLR